MAKIAQRRFQVEDGPRARFFDPGDEVPDEYEGRYDPKLVGDSLPVDGEQEQEVDPSGGSVELSPEEITEFEGLKTIEQITTWVGMGGPNTEARARWALEAEQAAGQRKGLIEALEATLGNGG